MQEKIDFIIFKNCYISKEPYKSFQRLLKGLKARKFQCFSTINANLGTVTATNQFFPFRKNE